MLERLTEDMKAAMRSGETVRRDTVRLLIAAVKKERIDKCRELTEADEIDVLTREAKRRREAIEGYTAANRADLADKEASELVVIQSYLPQAMSAEEVQGLIAQIIPQVGAQSPKDMGKVMGQLTGQIKGRFDGKQASELVKAALQAL